MRPPRRATPRGTPLRALVVTADTRAICICTNMLPPLLDTSSPVSYPTTTTIVSRCMKQRLRRKKKRDTNIPREGGWPSPLPPLPPAAVVHVSAFVHTAARELARVWLLVLCPSSSSPTRRQGPPPPAASSTVHPFRQQSSGRWRGPRATTWRQVNDDGWLSREARSGPGAGRRAQGCTHRRPRPSAVAEARRQEGNSNGERRPAVGLLVVAGVELVNSGDGRVL